MNSEDLEKVLGRKLTDQEKVRREKILALKKFGEEIYRLERIETDYSLGEVLNLSESLFEKELRCAGRLMVIREPFLILKENNNSLQLYIELKDENSKCLHTYFKSFVDIGDYLYVSGTLFRTKKGTLTLKLLSMKIVTKSLKPLPEKWAGIKDPELAIRNRVGNLIVNESLFNDLMQRARIISELRFMLVQRGYLEFETPILQKIAGGAIARPFKTFHNSLKEDLFLRIAPELYLKKLIISGYTKVFELGRSFRNEGVDSTHNPEFSSIEIYTAYQDFWETMDLTEDLIRGLARKYSTFEIQKNLDLKFNRVPIWELIESKTGLDFFHSLPSLSEALESIAKFGIVLEEGEKTLSKIYEKLFEDLISPHLIEPTFVYGFSAELSPLAKVSPENSFFSQRFELYISGKEIANGFSEQNNPFEQRKQFERQLLRKELSEENRELDTDYLSALEYGLPPTGGVGIGLDRLILVLLGRKSLKEIIAFPHLKG